MRRQALVLAAATSLGACQLVTGDYSTGASAAGGSSGGGSGSSGGDGAATDACSGGGTANLTPTTGQDQQGSLFVYETYGYLVTFSCATTITGIEFESQIADGGVGPLNPWVGKVWDATGTVLASGSTVSAEGTHSNISYAAVPGMQYIVGIDAADRAQGLGAFGDQWRNITLPFGPVGNVTVEKACLGSPDYDAAPADLPPTCSTDGQGWAISIVTQ